MEYIIKHLQTIEGMLLAKRIQLNKKSWGNKNFGFFCLLFYGIVAHNKIKHGTGTGPTVEIEGCAVKKKSHHTTPRENIAIKSCSTIIKML